MKVFVSLILAVALLLGATAVGEAPFPDEDFGFDFLDEGYEGNWVEIPALDVEFCLPLGWEQVSPPAGSAFSARNAETGDTLDISLEAEDVRNVRAWAGEDLPRYRVEEANFYDALVSEDEKGLRIYIVTGEDRLVRFDFRHTQEGSVTEARALEIVGTVCDIWDDEDAFQ